MRQRRSLLMGCALLIAHGLGCTDGEPGAADLPNRPRVSAPTTVRLPRPTAASRSQPATVAPAAPSAAEPADAVERSRNLTVEIEADPDIGRVPLTVQFHALVEGGTGPYIYEWDFGDGGRDRQSPTTHTYEGPGAYLATLVVSDRNGRSARQDVGVQVDAADIHDAVQ